MSEGDPPSDAGTGPAQAQADQAAARQRLGDLCAVVEALGRGEYHTQAAITGDHGVGDRLAGALNRLGQHLARAHDGRGEGLAGVAARFRTMVEGAPYGISECDREGRFVWLNPAHARTLGYEPQELIGRPVWAVLFDDAERAAFPAYYRELMEQMPSPQPYRGRNRRKDGGAVEVRVVWDYLRDAAGHATGLVSVLTDVTAQVQAEREARAGRDRYRDLLDTMPSIVGECDLQGRITYASPAYGRLLGYAPEEVVGTHIWDRQEDPDRLREAFAAAVANRPAALPARIWRVRTRDGRRAELQSAIGYRHDERGEVVGFVYVMTDVTEALEARREREQSREFSRLVLAAQEEERARVAQELHDTVLQSMAAVALRLGAMEMEGAAQFDPKELALARHEVTTAGDEIRRISKGLRPPELDELGLAASVRTLAEEWSRRTGVVCDVELAERLAPSSRDVELVVYRCLQNSLKNTERHAAASRVDVTLAADAGMLCLTVQDDGRGADLARIRRDGPALGLRSMTERARIVGGTVAVHTALGEGFRVDLRIPLTPPVGDR